MAREIIVGRDIDVENRGISVLQSLESVYGEPEIGNYLIRNCSLRNSSKKITTIVLMGAPGVSKTTLLSEITQELNGKLRAVFFDRAFSKIQNEYGRRTEWQEQGRVEDFWKLVNNQIIKDYLHLKKMMRKKDFREYVKGIELVCIGSPEHDRGISALKKLFPKNNRLENFFVVAIAPEEAKEGKITTQTQASVIRRLVEESGSPEDIVDNLTTAGIDIKNRNLGWSKRELGLQIRRVVTKMASEKQIIELNREIEKSVANLNRHDLYHIRSLIPDKFHNSPHVLHLMHVLKVRIRVPEGHYTVVFNAYNKNIRPQIDLGFNSKPNY